MSTTTTETPAPVLQGWKTFLFNGGVVVAGVVLTYLAQHGQEIVPAVYWPFIATMIPAINLWLRSKTTTSIFTKA